MSEIDNKTLAELMAEQNAADEKPKQEEKATVEADVSEDSAALNTEPESEDDDALPPELEKKVQKKIGSILSAERKKLKEKYERQRYQQPAVNNANYNAQAPEGHIFDENIGQYVPIESLAGQLALYREQERQYKLQTHQQQAYLAKQQERERIREAIEEGYDKYDDFDTALETFRRNGTDDMADALGAVDNPADVVHYFADKKNELLRISRLTPTQQAREIFRIEERLKPKRKLVTQAVEPVSKTQQTSTGKRAATTDDNWSPEQIDEYWRKKFKG